MTEILPVDAPDDILPEYRDGPVGRLLEYQNLSRPLGPASAELLVGMCMDSRKVLRIPSSFAYVIRTAGANMRDNEFRISYAIAIGGVRTIALVAHTDCGMTRVADQREAFIRGLVEHAGWDEARAEALYAEGVPKFAIDNAVAFVMTEAARLRELYPKISVVPLLYRVEDDRLYQLR